MAENNRYFLITLLNCLMVLNQTSKEFFCSNFLPLLNKKEKNYCFTQQDEGNLYRRHLDRSILDNRRRKNFMARLQPQVRGMYPQVRGQLVFRLRVMPVMA